MHVNIAEFCDFVRTGDKKAKIKSKYHRRSPHENKQAALNSTTINREKKKTDEKYVPD